MRTTAARTVARVVGVIVIVVGAVWVGQGLGYLPGSFMTGNRTWFWIGAACVLAGLGPALRLAPPSSLRRSPDPRGPDPPSWRSGSREGA